MKVVCEQCEYVGPPKEMRVEGESVVVFCGRCGHASNLGGDTSSPPPAATRTASGENPAPISGRPADSEGDSHDTDDDSVELAATESPSAPPQKVKPPAQALPPIRCPKCFHRQYRRDNCARCGIDLRRAGNDPTRWDPDPRGREESHARAVELWAAVLEAPDERQGHDTFFKFTLENNLSDLAARRYAERASDDPDHALTAEYLEKVRTGIQNVALAMLPKTDSDIQEKVKRVKRMLLAVSILLFIFGMMLLVIMYKRRQEIGAVDL
ncbi:MAG: hypothetical protein KC561_08775 [Myxococcales bacterium]|nr:hypothetical protein [Myxococcales bacterium]